MKTSIQYLIGIFVLVLLGAQMPEQALALDSGDFFAEETQPKGYTLSAAYPNPFNPSTSFTLTIRERQRVTVAIFNVLGHPVAELFDGVMQPGETRTFTFSAGDLPSGIYFYRVTGERFAEARQITLIK